MHALKKKCCIPSAARPFQCELCSKAFAKKEHLKKHLRTHSGLRPYVCDTCGKGFTRRGNRDRHSEIHLGTQRPKPTDETVEKEVFTFDFEVSSQHSLSAVDEQEQPNQKFRCSECPYSTDYKGNLDRHLMTHSGERPHQCLLCDKTFARKSDVKRHLLIHTKEGFQSDSATACDCDVCSGALEGEGRCLRLPDRKFHCTECRYSTNHKANLETHFLSHSGERPHQCELCDKAFTRKEHLSRHLRSHTGERPFSCDKCGKRFTRGTTLRHHEVATKGECHLTKASNTEQ